MQLTNGSLNLKLRICFIDLNYCSGLDSGSYN